MNGLVPEIWRFINAFNNNNLFEVKDNFISPVIIQTFRITYFDLILTVFSGAYDAME